MGSNRVHYGCLGVALSTPTSLPTSLLPGVQSVNVYSTKSTEYITQPGSSIPTNYYSTIPDIGFAYTEAFTTFPVLSAISGMNSYIDLFMYIGEDDVECFSARKYIRCKYLLLNSIRYSMNINGLFTCEKTYSGFSRYICTATSGITVPGCPGPATSTSNDLVGTRKNFNLSGTTLPATVISNNLIQEVSIYYTINRENITEPGTRTPYGSLTNFPIETRCSFTVASQNLDSYPDIFTTQTCSSLSGVAENLTLSICGVGNIINGSLNIPQAYLSSVEYGGGDVDGGNQTINIEYTSYYTTGISPLIEFPNAPATGCG